MKSEGASRLGSQLSLYALGNVLRQLSALVMLPIYTRYLSTSDYGQIELVGLIVLFASTTVGMSLGEGIFRQYHAARDEPGRRTVISTALWQGVAIHAGAAALLIAFSGPLSATLVGAPDARTLLIVCSLTLVTETINAVATCQMRAEGRALAFFWVSMARLVLNIAFNLVLLVGWGLGPLGVILSSLLTTALLAAYMLPGVLKSAGVCYSKAIGKALVLFGAPIAAANVVAFYVGAADRFALERYATLAVVGVYGLAARLAQSVLSLTYDGFESIWDTEKYRLWIGREQREPIQQVFRLVMFVLICATLAVGLFGEEIIGLLAPPAFAEAAAITPILTAAAALNCLVRFCRFGTLIGNRTFNVTIAALVSGAFLTGVCAVLVPRYVMFGAAFAILATALVRLVLEERLASRIVDLKLPWGRAFLATAVAVAVHVLAQRVPGSTATGIAAKIAILGGFAWLLWRSAFLMHEDREACFAVARTRLRRVFPSRSREAG